MTQNRLTFEKNTAYADRFIQYFPVFFQPKVPILLWGMIIGQIFLLSHAMYGQTYDTLYQNRIKSFTTDDRFFAESVGVIMDHPTVPSPLDHFGTIIGAPGVMHRTSEIYGYFQALAAASPNLIMEQAGTSEEGRPIHLITIASSTTLSNLDRYKEILTQLADPRKIDKTTADQLAQEGKPVYYLNGGMHSQEMGSPEMLMELSYRLVTDPSPEIQNILENTIVLINPISEPDGRDKQVDLPVLQSPGGMGRWISPNPSLLG